jgi:hypothetical protein
MSDWFQHKVAKLCPSPDPPAWRALAAFPGPPGPPLASRSPMSRAERKKKYRACTRVTSPIATSRRTGEATD